MKQTLGETIILFFEKWRINCFSKEIAFYQGEKGVYSKGFIDFLKEIENKDELMAALSDLTEKPEFRTFVLNQDRRVRIEEINKWTREQLRANNEGEFGYFDELIKNTKEYLSILDWDWYIQNKCCSISEAIPSIEDWKWVLLANLFNYYVDMEYGKFLIYEKGCPLDYYLEAHKLQGQIDNHYGLLKIDDEWKLKPGQPSRVFVPQLNTHLILRHISTDLIELIAEWRREMKFDLSVRPDYYVCGDGFGEKGKIYEEKDFGRSYKGKLSTVDSLSKYYDRVWVNDWLLVLHEGKDITFEEILEDGPHDQDNFVTQIVHMQYVDEGGLEYITHIDHEYAFYNESGMDVKRNKLDTKGEARTRYKTFKIDNAHIPFVNDTSRNILYKVLTCYFTKGELVDEYFNY